MFKRYQKPQIIKCKKDNKNLDCLNYPSSKSIVSQIQDSGNWERTITVLEISLDSWKSSCNGGGPNDPTDAAASEMPGLS